MAITKWKVFSYAFNFLCISLTFGLIVFWIYKFTLNEDLSIVEYQEYQKNVNDDFPLLSLCFRNPFVDDKGARMNETTRRHLEKYLLGTVESTEITHGEYSKMTFELKDFVKRYYILWRTGSSESFLPSDYQWKNVSKSFSGFWMGKFFKCFSLEYPSKFATTFSVEIENSVFPDGVRPRIYDFIAIFHYPNQILRTSHFSKYIWNNVRTQNGSIYESVFIADNVEIVQRRKRCSQNWANHDAEVMEHFVQKVGCTPPYYVSKSVLPLCTNNVELKNISDGISIGNNHRMISPPCKSMENINFKYDEVDWKGTVYGSTNGTFWMTLRIPSMVFKVQYMIYRHRNNASSKNKMI
jgi:hypothetical protein